MEFKYYFFTDKEAKDKDKAQSLAVPRLSVCADAQKVDRAKLAQTEVSKIRMMRVSVLKKTMKEDSLKVHVT